MDCDILKPQLLWINGSCYRKNPLKDSISQSYGGDTIDDYDADKLTNYCQVDEYGLDENTDTLNQFCIEDVNGRYKCALKIASAFYAIIIGKGGITRKRIENETSTSISIPKKVR